ncbi:MAG: NAD-dependent succinate-semialdehyde dehydrogenase [Abitibacteriaceae bacterium]|nr:NAD-dependent succinate-semialdehyde dehydrogenase [Abditibacteriaceae bacterium]MBV9866524.1 NAD-dependent succinate-semialdehyde dehydrogenase [Abditibacteriaceae bacterium]
MAIASINPATGETLKTFEPLCDAQIEEKLQRATETFGSYRRTPFAERAEKMLRSAEILEKDKEKFGRLMTTEMGKPLKAAIEEAVKCAKGCRYYAENAEKFLADEVVATEANCSYIHYQPIGPVLAIMPWNFPFWQVFRFAAPALMAGNVGLLKHASNVPQCALAIEEIFEQAGFPAGAFQTLLVSSDKIPQIIDDPRIKAATLTGSEPAGSSTASAAGKQIKKTVLELGGSDPFIVMPSADLDAAVKTAVQARVINNGQSCIAAKRFIVHESIAEEFEQRFVEIMAELKVGDPLDEATHIGPLATEDILKGLDEQVQKLVSDGARLLTGGKKLDRPGNYYAPTALADIPTASPTYHEEIFGPVASLFRVKDIEEAITLANDTTFGLGSSAWTNDQAERNRFIEDIEAGMVFINSMVASDPRLPFGGVKHSGYGRELGTYGIREFVNIKTVWIKESGGDHRTGTE